MRTFLELLPYRIGQAFGWRASRAADIERRRRLTAPTSAAPLAGRRRLFIDLTVISNHDAGTGIQRVVRALALALLKQAPPEEWEIQFVAAGRKKRYHCVAWADHPGGAGNEEMRARPGDIFLGLDFSLDTIRRHNRQLASFRRGGGVLWFVIYDLLPLRHAEWFAPALVQRYEAWLATLAGLADGFLCISPQTEIELREVLAEAYGLSQGYQTRILSMGHAILDAPEGRRTPVVPRFDVSTPYALMVGTLEPRKGHADVIAAYEELWRQGHANRLVLVGRLGWQVEALRDRILTHPEYGAKLLWFSDVEDGELFGMYEASSGVIIASHGEGFGLPLIEALGHGKPVLARDLPVFRAHEGKGVRYFSADASLQKLAVTINQWFDASRRGEIPVICPTGDWRESAHMLLKAIE